MATVDPIVPTPENPTPAVGVHVNLELRRAQAKTSVDCATSALAVWAMAARSGAELDSSSACDLQVAAAAIDASLEPAAECASTLEFLHGRLLVRMLDTALWNYAAGEVEGPPSGDALAATARMAIDFLTTASAEFSDAPRSLQ